MIPSQPPPAPSDAGASAASPGALVSEPPASIESSALPRPPTEDPLYGGPPEPESTEARAAESSELDQDFSKLSHPPPPAPESEPPQRESVPSQVGVVVAPLAQALALRVLLGGRAIRMRTVYLGSVGVACVLVALAVLAVVRSAEQATVASVPTPASAQPAASASARPATSAAPAASTSAHPEEKKPPSLLERAAAGESAAMDKLEARPQNERSADEAVALARGRAVKKQKELDELGAKLAGDPELATDEETIKSLLGYADDARTAPAALRIMANMPGPTGPDLLYHVWTRTRDRTDTTQLAEELLFTKDVRPKASDALGVIIDLREADKDCERIQVILTRAIEHGDRRSRRSIARLFKKRGCGENERQDCYKCLRDKRGKRQLRDALRAVKRRRAPSFK